MHSSVRFVTLQMGKQVMQFPVTEQVRGWMKIECVSPDLQCPPV